MEVRLHRYVRLAACETECDDMEADVGRVRIEAVASVLPVISPLRHGAVGF